VDAAAVWSAVAEERVRLADDLAPVDPSIWDRPSRCGVWTVHQVLAHIVVLAEGTVASVMGGTFRASPLSPAKGIERVAIRTASSASPDELRDRLGAACSGRFVVPGLPPIVALGEVLVHRSDVTDAAGLPPLAADERLRAVLEAEVKLWFAFGAPRTVRRLRFRPTDANWSVGPPDGPLLEGPAQQLLLAATGRSGIEGLTGPGATLLRAT
jgi:uncharacterized protein (TIGR03083 family)